MEGGLGFVRRLVDFHASGVNEARGSPSRVITSGAVFTIDSGVQLNHTNSPFISLLTTNSSSVFPISFISWEKFAFAFFLTKANPHILKLTPSCFYQ